MMIDDTQSPGADEIPDENDGNVFGPGGNWTGKRGRFLNDEIRPDSPALLNDTIEISPTERLPLLDRGATKAYAARIKGETNPVYFAMICADHLVPRSRSGSLYASISSPALARLVASGPVFWPPEKIWKYCFIYENTLGAPLLKPGDPLAMGMRQDHAMNFIVRPLTAVLTEMRNTGIVHGHINPMNMFNGNDPSLERIMLGDCLSVPCSYAQPTLYEPVEKAMCNLVARGGGTSADDLYSFGVSLAIIIRRKDPMPGFSDEEIIKEKIEHGSYTALMGKERLTADLLELMRGLLYDDPGQRWTVDDIHLWMEGQRLTPKQSAKQKKAVRPLLFNGEKYLRQRVLAMDLDKNQAEAVHLIESSQLAQWVERSVDDTRLAERMEDALQPLNEVGRGAGFWDRLMSRVAMALDPDAPIRYRGMRLNPEGIAKAMAEAFVLRRDIQPFAEIINQQMVVNWVKVQSDSSVDIGSLMSRLDNCRAFLKQGSIGYGIERCLYYLAPEVHCLSDRLRAYYVRSPEEMMYAFEDMSARPNRPELFIDRHIAAFLSVKDRRVIDAHTVELNSSEPHRKVMGNLKTLASIQKRSRMETFPGIAGWIASALGPAYARIHDRELRAKIVAKIEQIKADGDLSKIAALLDSTTIIQNDMAGFRTAMRQYADLRTEYRELKADLGNPRVFGRESGMEVAATISGVLSAIIMIVFGFLHFMKNGGS